MLKSRRERERELRERERDGREIERERTDSEFLTTATCAVKLFGSRPCDVKNFRTVPLPYLQNENF